jgi:outer membrane protein OmpA-like peptidoglycan-associated protein
MKKIASISTNPKRNLIEARLLMGTMLSAVVWGSVQATPLDKALVVAQAATQGEQEAPQRPGQRQKQQEERREAPKPPPGAQPPGRPQERQVQPPPTPGEQPPGRRQERQVQPPPTPGEQPPGRRQERQVQPPSTPGEQPPGRRQERQVQPPPSPGEQPPGRRQERQVQPPPTPGEQERQVQPPPTPGEQPPGRRQERQVQPPPGAQPPGSPQERQVQPPPGAQPPGRPQERQVQPPPTPGAQPPGPAQERQVQPPPTPGAQPPGRPQERQVQPPPTPSAQPPGPPPSAEQPGQRGAGGPTGVPPRAIAPQQPVGAPAIAPSALQPPTPPTGSAATQAQRAFVPPPAQDSARRLDDVRGARREVREGDRVMIQEPGRVIIREGGRTIIRHNEVDRFRWQARDVHIERRGADTVTVFARPDGSRIYTETDESGRLLRRYRRAPDGREVIIIDNRYSGPPRVGGYFIDLPPPVIRIPRERYIVDAQYARPDDIYGALWAAPVENIERPYTLDEIRYSPRLLERMPRVDLDTVTFDTGSWEVTPDQVERLAVVADGINRAIAANPREVFLVEGHTDAVGSDVDNLSLSDRRAESVALALSQQFGVPAENLTTQGYGEQYLKVPTQGPEQANRRVTVRRITPLLTGQNEAVPVAPR